MGVCRHSPLLPAHTRIVPSASPVASRISSMAPSPPGVAPGVGTSRSATDSTGAGCATVRRHLVRVRVRVRLGLGLGLGLG